MGMSGTAKVHTLDVAPLRESLPQKRSGTARRVLEGFHRVLPAHPDVHPQSE